MPDAAGTRPPGILVGEVLGWLQGLPGRAILRVVSEDADAVVDLVAKGKVRERFVLGYFVEARA